MHLTANLPRNLPVKKILKSVKNWHNYGHESVAPFFGPPCKLFKKSYLTKGSVEKYYTDVRKGS